MNTTTSPLRHSDIDAYRAWRFHRVGPSHLRGMPTWMWRTALRGRVRSASPPTMQTMRAAA